jgi:hypothetical protein
MNCQNAQELISVLYDGEPVPTEFADHVETCQTCRENLRAYSEIGAELRLLASRSSSSPVLPPSVLYQGRSRGLLFSSFMDRIPVPKFAVAAAAGVLLVMTVGLMRVHAQQSNPLWFQFTLTEKGKKADFTPQNLAQAGYDDYVAGGTYMHQFGTHVRVSSVQADQVTISLRSRLYQVTNADDMHLKADLENFSGGTLAYHPGESLEIPVEGGGTLVLEGKIFDHKPRFMIFGIPLEPSSDQLIVTSPVLISGNKVLANMKGANTLHDGQDSVVVLYAPGTGLLKVALQPFPGAVQAMASWGNLDFKLGGQNYTLLTASQICGGDQPRTLWAGIDAEYRPEDSHLAGGFLGSRKLSEQ